MPIGCHKMDCKRYQKPRCYLFYKKKKCEQPVSTAPVSTAPVSTAPTAPVSNTPPKLVEAPMAQMDVDTAVYTGNLGKKEGINVTRDELSYQSRFLIRRTGVDLYDYPLSGGELDTEYLWQINGEDVFLPTEPIYTDTRIPGVRVPKSEGNILSREQVTYQIEIELPTEYVRKWCFIEQTSDGLFHFDDSKYEFTGLNVSGLNLNLNNRRTDVFIADRAMSLKFEFKNKGIEDEDNLYLFSKLYLFISDESVI